MIYSGSNKFLYIAIPKTGTSSVRAYLEQNYGGQKVGHYHQWWDPGGLPPELTKWTVVRNPYERCFSRWWFEAMRSPDHCIRVPYKTSFADFMRWLVEHKYEDESTGTGTKVAEINMSQYDFYTWSGCQRYVRLERFYDDFRLLPFVEGTPAPLPKRRRTPGKDGISFFEYFRGPS